MERLGLLNPDEARAAGAAIRAGAVPALDAVIERLREVAQLSGNDQLIRQASDLAAKQAELKAQTIEAQRDLAASAQAGAQDYVRSIGDMSTQARTVVTSAFKSMEDALVQFVQTGKLDFASLANSIIADLIRIQVQQSITKPLAQAIQSGGGLIGMFKGLFGGGGDAAQGGGWTSGYDLAEAAVAHTGYGPGDIMSTRRVPASTFAAAPRFHSGVGPNERAAIITRDESVLTPGQMRQLAPAGAGGGGNISIQIIEAPGTTANVSAQAGPNGAQLIKVIIEQVSDDIAGQFNGGGRVAQAAENAYGLRRQAA